MPKIISIKILKVQYSGDSVGNDIRIETEISGQVFKLNQKIKQGTTFEFDQEIAQLQIDDVLETSVRVKITEKDFIFNDVGETKSNILINTAVFPQIFDFQIKVQENNGPTFGKSIAIFTITIVVDFPLSNLKQYKSTISGQNYNEYDTAIENAVDYWNKEFLNQTNPPPVSLDPNLVKAMVYVESKMGYFVPRKILFQKRPPYPSYPDVMQVGDPRNGALFVLKNIYDPKKKKLVTEYEIINGKKIPIEYSDANIDTPERSIYWGIRWLFRKARKNIKQVNGVWTRKWIDWKEAVHLYNTGDSKYVDKVYKVYEQGIGDNKFKLWNLIFFLPIFSALFLGGWFALNQGRAFVSFQDVSDSYNYKVMVKIINGPWFENTLVANAYIDGGNFFAPDKNQPIITRYIDIDHDRQKEITITGTNYPGNVTKYIFKKENGKYKVIHNIDKWGSEREAFSSGQISFQDENNDGVLEVVEDFYLPYSNAPDQIWSSFYRFDEKYYRFYKRDIVNVSDFKRFFTRCAQVCVSSLEVES